MYQVGHLIHYQADDPLFASIGEAREFIKREYTEYCDHPVGIWWKNEKSDPLEEIFMQGQYFVRVPAFLLERSE